MSGKTDEALTPAGCCIAEKTILLRAIDLGLINQRVHA
jgi:hypothetical protein